MTLALRLPDPVLTQAFASFDFRELAASVSDGMERVSDGMERGWPCFRTSAVLRPLTSMRHRLGRREESVRSGQEEKRETIRAIFWPPKPKLLLRACWKRASRAVLGT